MKYLKLLEDWSLQDDNQNISTNQLYWVVVSEDEIIGIYNNPKDANKVYQKEWEMKKELYFDKYVDNQIESGRRVMDSGLYSDAMGYTSPPESTITDEEYDEYFEDNYSYEIYVEGPIDLNNAPKHIQELMSEEILNDIAEYGCYEV